MSKAIGIDLGTTNSVVAYINGNGQAEIISSSEGGRTIPSVFSITADGTRLIGRPAIDQEITNFTNTVRSIKRKMGTSDRLVIQDVTISPEEISAEILSKIKSDAEAYLNDTVDAAVITVPAYFNSDQRQATKTAGELAGLKVLRVINEPTAASLAYGLDKNKNERVLVFDLGGGTFDVTVLEITSDGVFDVISTSGDTHLGGDDFDKIINEMIIENLEKDFPGYVLFPESPARIREDSEQAKIRLSSTLTATINIPYVGIDKDQKPINFKISLTRQQFEEHPKIIALLDKIKSCMNMAMNDAKIDYTEIDEVVFVGGSTRIPIVGQKVKEWTGKNPNRSINPDEAVALGAAIQAGVLSGQTEKNVLLLDVTPLSLGIETLGGVMTVMIVRNTTVPCEYSDIFSTAEDNQSEVGIRVYQGERPQVKNNKYLGEFKLTEILAAPRGIPQIEVTFDIDANGILSVKALDKATDLEQTVIISGNSSLTSEEIARIMDDAQTNAKQDQIFKELSDQRIKLREQLVQIDAILRESEEDLEDDLIIKLKETKQLLETSDKEENIDNLKSLQDIAQKLIDDSSEKIYEKADSYIMGE